MIAKEQARELVVAEACGKADWMLEGDEFIIVDEFTIEKPWGWVFFYTSKLWYETKDFQYAIAGNFPILVEKQTGRLVVVGSGINIDSFIESYEPDSTADA